MGISNIIFILLFVAAVWLFTWNIRKVRRNILLGREEKRNDRLWDRLKLMMRVAFGQTKMIVKPIPGILHFFVYAGFIIINIEVLEIIIDGIFGTHRSFAFLGKFYGFLISSFEYLALSVLLACLIFLIRRNILNIKRFRSRELTTWPRSDANIILTVEVLLMSAFLLMNAADQVLMQIGSIIPPENIGQFDIEHYSALGDLGNIFPISMWLTGLLPDNIGTLIFIERFCWWFHIIGILAFLNYLPYSKHFHIILAFPNVFYSNLNAKGKFTNNETVTREVRLMLDPSAPAPPATENNISQFGAKDVTDLTWKNLLDAYSCTECGRCTAACPANQTGKLLSPRKIMMDTRDRLEEVGKNIDKHGKDYKDEKTLVNDYILPEELWACTTCNACVQACPVNIDPLNIIVELRRYLVMEQSAAPAELNGMFTNIENNGAPWQFPAADRLNWAKES